jgi:hypothetical protein
MLCEEVVNRKKNILPWDGELIFDFYRSPFQRLFTEEFFELIQEAYKCFLYDAQRASITMSAEALLRILYDQTIILIEKGIPFKTKSFSLNHESTRKDMRKLEMTNFQSIVDFLEQNAAYSDELIKKIRVVQDIRNKAAHRELPIISEWDPDDPRSREEKIRMFNDLNFEFPEGYMVYTSKADEHWHKIDLRKYNCGSLKSLNWKDKIAIIQYLSVLDILYDIMNQKTCSKPMCV